MNTELNDGNVVCYVGSKAIIENDKNQVLIVKEIWSGKWGLPGGRIQETEIETDIKDCLVREVKEELGDSFKIKVESFFDTMFRVFGRPKNPDVKSAFAVFFVCKYLSGEIKLQESELSEYAWVNSCNFYNYEYISGYKNMLEKYFKTN